MPTPDFEALARPGIRALRAYDPGHDIVALRRRFAGRLVELGSNESPFGPSPRASQAARDSLASAHRYPDPLGSELKQALASQWGLDVAQLVLGNGSHELLMMLAQAFAGPDAGVLASEFGFAVYGIAAQAAGAPFARIAALDAAHATMPRGHDLDAIAAGIGQTTRLVYLANPNNPTGTWFSSAALGAFLERVPAHVLVVVDEAYLEFVTEPGLVSATALLARHPNLVVTRTFSKAHGLAGLRVGYACAHPGLVAILERVRESFNVGGPGLSAALASLSDPDHLDRVRRDNAAERAWLGRELQSRGCLVSPSQTNFLLLDFQRDTASLEAALVGEGIVLRPMAGYGLPDCLRVTVGARDDNLRLLAALDRRQP